MTYQELLDEFCKRRATSSDDKWEEIGIRIGMLIWAMQSLLEKLRDEREGPK